ncbi:MICAL-like protein 1 [Pleuronectes platessa]|uniref:MICAL-like protein 1 n=1 Tax=Pleuronectes platessa TaxID=8262 RepID=UPI00232A5849|nr:MICAL-like protein 1 [Pleuronectes platessa]
MSELIPSPRTLLDWCRVTCTSYPSVEISNMSTSFRDGLAFCAIIHRHRPDLIDFRSLSKHDVYLNHKLAFQVAETKLGIPALLDPKELVSTRVPDCLSVISYLSYFYCVFNRTTQAGSSGSRSSLVFNKSKTPDGLKPLKSSTHLETDRLSTRPRTVCNLCFKPVHLIQRHLIDGKVFHRSCFRCKLCHSTLLPESYTQGSDAASFICSDHFTDSKNTHVDLKQKTGSAEDRPKRVPQSGYVSLCGLAVSSVPHYTETTESRDRPVWEAAEAQERSSEVECRDNRDSAAGPKNMLKTPAPPHLPPPHPPLPRPPPPSEGSAAGAGKDEAAPLQTDGETQQEPTETHQLPEPSSPCGRVMEGSGQQVPAPRETSDSSVVPVPAPRTRTSQTTTSSPAAGASSNQSIYPLRSSQVSSSTLKPSHPWMTIIHPGPWTQLPPAPPPVPTPRTKSVSKRQGPWYGSKVTPPNPFEEYMKEEEESSVEVLLSESQGSLVKIIGATEVIVQSDENTKSDVNLLDEQIPAETTDYNKAPPGGASLETSSEPAANSDQILSTHVGENGGTCGSHPDVTEASASPHVDPDEGQSPVLPRSLSVPVITSAHSQGSSLPAGLGSESASGWQSKPTCRENPFDRNPTMIKSKTFQALTSQRAPAPGHGFPLIKRKVQSDQHVSTEALQMEMREVEKRLEALQHRGVELEKNLRDCRNDKEEERMLMEWFSLLHEKQALVRRDTELLYLTKQQKLEERQADVEYELRCILNRPETDWSQEDRGREQRLMEELVAIIEQRNQIISSLDVDRQREREEDELSEDKKKNKALQREELKELKELKKAKGKFKPTNVFKMLNHKAESIKGSSDKKS